MTGIDGTWKQFALILIDLQHDFWPEKLAQCFPDFPAKITQLLDFCRTEGLEVIHLRTRFRADRSDWMPRYRLRGRIPCIQGTTGAETLPFALDRPGETILVKQAFDGFHNPELLQYLQRKGKRFILTAGLVTSTCVLFTTVSAAQKGFLTAVVEDCCADEPSAHEQTLDRYRFIFDRTAVNLIPDHYHEWVAALEELAEPIPMTP
jgi:nicotinamidase-related amidase